MTNPTLLRPAAPEPRTLRGPGGAPALDDMTIGFCAAGAAIAVADTGMRILAVNAAYAAMTGCAPAELFGRLLQGVDAEGMIGGTAGSQRAGQQCARHWEGEIVLQHRDGHTGPVWMCIDAVADARGAVQRYVLTCTDISALKREQEALRHQAEHDPLTGLPHRAHFAVELQRAIAGARRHGRQFALLFVDIDHFKRVNDTLGHAVGDQLLHEIGQRLQQSVRAEDLVARLGGDEFTVLLQDVAHIEQATRLARVMLAAIERSVVADGRSLHVSASIGIALFPDDAENASDLMRAADAAMYCAKHGGRGRVASAGDATASTSAPTPLARD